MNASQPTQGGRPQAILFGIAPHGDPRTAPEILRELALLADTGSFEVIGCMLQHRRTPDPASFLGAGKLAEIKEVVDQAKAAVVICNDSLSPTQGRNVEKAVGELTTLLELMNEELFRRGRGRFFLTTASVALKIGPTLHVVCVGDSPVFLIRGRDIMPLTATAKGHTYVGIANALGRQATLSYKTTAMSLRGQDRLVLATDGLIENVAPGEVAALMDDVRSPEEAVSALRQLLCEKKRGNKGRVDDRSGFRRDDATAIIRYIDLNPLSEAAGLPENSHVV